MSGFCISLTRSCLCVFSIVMQFHSLHFTRQKRVLTAAIAMLLSHNSVQIAGQKDASCGINLLLLLGMLLFLAQSSLICILPAYCFFLD